MLNRNTAAAADGRFSMLSANFENALDFDYYEWMGQAPSPTEIKYDFDIVVTKEGRDRVVIYSFGGDRETFAGPPPETLQPEEDLRVDNDVWRFAPPAPWCLPQASARNANRQHTRQGGSLQ